MTQEQEIEKIELDDTIHELKRQRRRMTIPIKS